MGWFTSLFSSDPPQRSRTGQVFSSTHEAFSLPTSSPVFATHPDAFNPEALNTPDPEAARTPAMYTYPPRGPYGYVPSSGGFISRPASSSLLPTHMDPSHSNMSPHPSYPPLSKTWARLRNWLTREYPELGDTLNYGILPQDLAQIEMQFGFALPSVVKESYLCVDGQEAESAAGCSEGLFFGLTLLPLENVLEEWKFWREVDSDPTTGSNGDLREIMQSIPPGWVRKEYSQRGWIPLIADKAGNYVGVDLNPGEGGSVGQVIVFGRDFDTKVVLWSGDGPNGWAKWLANFVEELETGDGFEIGANDASEGSEDDVGYESYFYDGYGRGQGDGGGDNGAGGGLRYTGEYRGWNVLEAWADRSLRKWHDAGLIPDDAMIVPAQPAKAPEEQVDIADLPQQGSETEVSIPILNYPSEEMPSPDATPTKQATKHLIPKNAKLPPTTQHPSISVTKLPAPRPVELPTALDIAPVPSPPHSSKSSLDDLESGRTQEPYEDVGLVTSTRRMDKSKSPGRRETSDASGSALLMSPQPPMSPDTSLADSINPLVSAAESQDLLADTTIELETPPIEPSPKPTPQTDLLPTPTEAVSDVNGLTEEPESVPDTTIRLVGGGGSAGVVESPVLPPSRAETPVEVVTQDTEVTVTSGNSPDKGNKKHKKSKSGLAGLKRFSQLGHLRKRDSASSIKDVPNPSIK